MTPPVNTPAVAYNPEQSSAPPPQPVCENTGRWTAEEHRLFLQGLEQHGKGWKKIATLIKTRTVVQIRTHAQKYFQKLAKARQSGAACLPDGRGGGCVASTAEAVDGGGGITIPYGPDGRPVVTMRTMGTSGRAEDAGGNMSLGSDPTSLAAAAGGGATVPVTRAKSRRRNAHVNSGTKRRSIGNIVRSAVREDRNVKRQRNLEAKSRRGKHAKDSVNLPAIANPVAAAGSLLDPFVTHMRDMPTASSGNDSRGGRNQMVHTATHGTLPQAALEDALFRMLTPAPTSGNPPPPCPSSTPPAAAASAIQAAGGMGLPSDPLAVKLPQSYKTGARPVTNVAPYGVHDCGSNASPTCVATDLLLPSWVDPKNPPTWYDEGGDIDTLLDDAGCLDWLADTGDLQEDYPPAPKKTTYVAVSNSSSRAGELKSEPSSETLSYLVEPTPVGGPAESVFAHEQPPPEPTSVTCLATANAIAAVTAAPSEELHNVASAPVEDVHVLPSFLEESKPPPHVLAVPYAAATETADAVYAAATEVADPDCDRLPPAECGTEEDTRGCSEDPSPAVGLMGFPELDMGDEQAFVSALLENSSGASGVGAVSFPRIGSAGDGLDRHDV